MRLLRRLFKSNSLGTISLMASVFVSKKYSPRELVLRVPLKAVARHSSGIMEGTGVGELVVYSKKGTLKGNTNRPIPILTVISMMDIAIAVNGLTRKRKSRPSLPMTLFHQDLR